MRVWLVLAVLFLVPGAVAQGEAASTPAALYIHVISAFDYPINTQEPDDGWSENAHWGPVSTTLTCLHETTGDIGGTGQGTAGMTSQSFNTLYAYGSPNLVEYEYKSKSGFPRVHPERGLAADVVIDTAVPAVFTWYLSVDADNTAPGTTPEALPNVVVRATVRVGSAISIDGSKTYDSGNLLMQGQSPPVTLIADKVIPAPGGNATGVTSVGMLDGMWVYQVQVPLDVQVPIIPAREGFNVRVDVFFDSPACDPDSGMVQPSYATHTSPGHRPRIDLSIVEPFRVDYANPQFVGDDVVLHFGVNSVWGPYDLDLADVEFELTGPSGAGSGFVLQPQLPRYHEHGHSYAFEPLPLTYVWKDGKATLGPGHYEATLRIPNLQHTAMLETKAAFDVAPANEAPGLAVPLLGMALLALAVFLRRAQS